MTIKAQIQHILTESEDDVFFAIQNAYKEYKKTLWGSDEDVEKARIAVSNFFVYVFDIEPNIAVKTNVENIRTGGSPIFTLDYDELIIRLWFRNNGLIFEMYVGAGEMGFMPYEPIKTENFNLAHFKSIIKECWARYIRKINDKLVFHRASLGQGYRKPHEKDVDMIKKVYPVVKKFYERICSL